VAVSCCNGVRLLLLAFVEYNASGFGVAYLDKRIGINNDFITIAI
jgi:hypothetical protein